MSDHSIRRSPIYVDEIPAGREQRQVIFIKVHKAASSTVQNILLRFSLARDLNILLPLDPRDHLNDFGSEINPNKIIPHPTGGLFDILCDHIIFNENTIAPYFPDFAVRVAIVRDPLQQMLSALAYFTHVFKRPDLMSGLERFKQAPLEGFLNHPGYFYNPSQGVAGSYINNRMSVDLGFDLKNFEESKKNMTKIRGFLANLEKQFDLILLANYFDESMVLLRRFLNWTIKDVMYLELNTANGNREGFEKSDLNQRPSFNSTTVLAFRKWAAIDYALYDHFLTIFLNKIQKEKFLQEEVSAFREARDLVAKFCAKVNESYDVGNDFVSIEKTEWTEAFTVSEYECQLMSMHELDLVSLAIERQKKRIKSSQIDIDIGIEEDID